MDKDEITFLRKVIKAQDELLTCYRLGRQPVEWALNILAKFRSIYDNSQTASEPTTPADAKILHVETARSKHGIPYIKCGDPTCCSRR